MTRAHELRIHALGAAISRREWHEVEVAHTAIRDAAHRDGDSPVLPDVGAVANAIWLAIRDREDRSDMALKDMPYDCVAWEASRAVLALLKRERT